MYRDARAAVIIPALDEEEAIGAVISAIDRRVVDRVVVVDNGCRDATGARAAEQGAEVVREPRRGYGSACLAGIDATHDADVLVFVDGDGSDDPVQIPLVLATMWEEHADLVVGSRTLGGAEPGALTPLQLFGSWLTCNLVRLFWQVEYTDLGPFRAVRRQALERLAMSDPDFGWKSRCRSRRPKSGCGSQKSRFNCGFGRQDGPRSAAPCSVRAGRTILRYVFEARLREMVDR